MSSPTSATHTALQPPQTGNSSTKSCVLLFQAFAHAVPATCRLAGLRDSFAPCSPFSRKPALTTYQNKLRATVTVDM